MLTFFQIEKTFNKLTLRFLVDVKAKRADLTVTYGGRIVGSEDRPLSFVTSDNKLWNVSTVEGAEAYLSRDMGERGNLPEYLEHHYRRQAA